MPAVPHAHRDRPAAPANWIGGRAAPDAAAPKPSSPAIPRPARRWPRSRSPDRTGRGGDHRRPRRARSIWARMTGIERGRMLRRVADHPARPQRRAGGAGNPRYRQADPGDARRRCRLGRRLHRVFRRPRRRHHRGERRSRPLRDGLYAARATGGRRRHRRLELSAADRLLEGGARARLRQCDDLQAVRTHAADRARARGDHGRGRRAGRRLQRRAGRSAETGQPADAAIRRSRKISLTGSVPHGQAR